jgi:sec-independent protein translocase protein TatB
MFDIGWSEMLVIAVVTVVVVGPKELPRMLRTFGRTMGTVRRTANDFKRQFDEALREAEREAGLEDTRKQLQSITAGAKKDLDDSVRAANRPLMSATANPTPAKPPTLAPAAAQEAEPVKTGASSATGGADAA